MNGQSNRSGKELAAHIRSGESLHFSGEFFKPVELIYLACPFRHADLSVQRKRCAAAHYVAAKLSSQGRHIFSPLTHNELLIDIIQDTIPSEHWMQFDLAILAACKRLFILTMEGWQLSKGVQREILFARERSMPIEEIEPPAESLFLPFLRASS